MSDNREHIMQALLEAQAAAQRLADALGSTPQNAQEARLSDFATQAARTLREFENGLLEAS